MGGAPEQPFSYEKMLSIIVIPSSRGSSGSRDRTWVSNVSCSGKRVFYHQRHLGSPVTTRQMQIKMTMQYHLPPAKMAIIKKTGDNKCWQRYGEEATLMHCWREHKWVQPLLKGRWRFLNNLKIELPKTNLPYDPAMPQFLCLLMGT